MIRSILSLEKYELLATDGVVGEVRDLLFDDDVWQVRYFVIETGRWLSSRQVLVSPEAIRQPEWDSRRLPAELTKDQVRGSPAFAGLGEWTRTAEAELRAHYGWSDLAPLAAHSEAVQRLQAPEREAVSPGSSPGAGAGSEIAAAARGAAEQSGAPRLRSARAIIDYHVEATDGNVGHIDDVLVDLESGDVRFLVVDTRKWLRGRHVLVPPGYVRNLSWAEAHVVVALDRQIIETSPSFDPAEPVLPEHVRELQQHYARPPAARRD